MHAKKQIIRLLNCQDRRDLSVLDVNVHVFPNADGEAEILLNDDHALCLFSTDARSSTRIADGLPIDIHWPASSFGFTPAGTHVWHSMHAPHDRALIRIPKQRFDAHAGTAELRPLIARLDPVISGAASALANLAAEPTSSATPQMVDGLTNVLVTRVQHLMQQANPEPVTMPAPRMRRVLEYIENNMDGEIRLPELASVAALSQFHFHRAFSGSMGMSPMRYVWGRRIERSKGLLRNPTIPLVDVAFRCGFSSQSHFSTMFKRATGMTPGEYRKCANSS